MKTILIVQPDGTSSHLLRAIFARHYRVLEASDGETTLGVICIERPDLVLLELMLPDLPGAEVCRLVKRDREMRSTRMVVLTVAADAGSRRAAIQAGADRYITKPFSPAILRREVEELLEGNASGRARSG